MAGKADGQVLVDTKCDSSGFEKGSEELLVAIRSLVWEMKNLGITIRESLSGKNIETKGSENQIQQLEEKAQGLTGTVAELQTQLSGASSTVSPTVDVSQPRQAITAFSRELNRLDKELSQMDKLTNKVLNGDRLAMTVFLEHTDKARQMIDSLSGSLDQMKDARIPTDNYLSVTSEIQKSNKALEELQARQEKMQATGVKESSKSYKSLQYDIESTKRKLHELEIDRKVLEEDGGAFISGADTDQIQQYITALTEAKKRFEDVERTVMWVDYPTKAYKRLTVEIERAGDAVSKLKERQNKMEAIGVGEDSREYKSLQYDVEQAIQKLKELQAKEAKLRENGGAYEVECDTEPTDRYATSVQNAIEKLETLQGKLNQTDKGGSKFSTIGQLVKKFLTLPFRLATTAVSGTLKAIGKLAAISGEVTGLNKIAGTAKKAAASFLHLGKSAKSADKGMLSNFATMIKYGLGLRSLYTLVNKAKSAMVSGFENLARFSDQTNASISSVKSALTRLKNSLSTAFAPILIVVAPAITQLINMLSNAITYIGMFMAALTGATTFTKAVAVQEDYAASLNGTASAAEKAGNSVKEASRQVASFDELNILSDTSSDSNGSDTDSGTGTDVMDMFEEVPIESRIFQFVQRIKDTFAAGDYAGVGRIIGTKINGALQTIKDYIQWDNVGGTISKYVLAFCSSFNALIDTIDWDLLGSTFAAGFMTLVNTAFLLFGGVDWHNIGESIATGLNAAIRDINWVLVGNTLAKYFMIRLDALHGAVTTFDWAALGRAFGNGINGFAGNYNWAELGETLSASFIGALTALRTAITTIDWYQLGQDVKTFLCNIDWAGIVSEVFGVIGAAVGGLAEFLWGLLGEAWDNVVNWWYDTAYEDGSFTMEGLLQGILDALSSIGEWIKTNIFDPFVNGFKDVFGIHSPSTVMAEQGGFLISGLLQGITDNWSDIASFLSESCENVRKTVSEGFNKAKSAVSTAVSGMYSKVSSKFSSIASKVSTKVSDIKEKIRSGFETAKNNIIEKMSDALTTVDGQDWLSVGSNICSGISNGLDSGWSWLTEKVSGLGSSLLESAKSVLGIHSPSRLFRDEVGYMLGLGVAEGMEKSEPVIIRSVSAMAEQISNEFNGADVSIPAEADGLDAALDSFSDRVSDSFSNLVDTLSAIADKVAYMVPSVATGGLVPYEVAAKAAGGSTGLTETIETLNEELCSVFIQTISNATVTLVSAIEKYSGTTVNVDANSLAQSTINEINRRTRMMGQSPLLTPREV